MGEVDAMHAGEGCEPSEPPESSSLKEDIDGTSILFCCVEENRREERLTRCFAEGQSTAMVRLR
jgi:hypothetical protein